MSFRVGPKLHAAIKDRAAAEEKSVSEWARQALELALSDTLSGPYRSPYRSAPLVVGQVLETKDLMQRNESAE